MGGLCNDVPAYRRKHPRQCAPYLGGGGVVKDVLCGGLGYTVGKANPEVGAVTGFACSELLP